MRVTVAARVQSMVHRGQVIENYSQLPPSPHVINRLLHCRKPALW